MSQPKNYFKIDTENADIFKMIFRDINVFTKSLVLLIEPERIFLQTMDPSHVSVIEMVLPKSWFSEYSVEKPIRIGFDASIFSKILSTAKRQPIQFDLSEDHCTIIIADATIDKHFDMPLMELDQDILEIPPMEYDADWTVSSKDWAEWIKNLKMFSDHLEMNISEEAILLKSKSVERGGMTAKIDVEKLLAFSINEGEEIKMSFSLSYMYNISQFHELAKQVNFHILSGNPIQVVYDIGSDAVIRFFLAPKIADDDDD